MKFVHRDILTVSEGTLFHQVSTYHTMGAGLAKQIADKWPIVLEDLQRWKPALGDFRVVEVSPSLFVVSLVGQQTIGFTGKHTLYWAVARGLRYFYVHHSSLHKDCYFPLYMGCGLGGGDWHVYLALIQEHFPRGTICNPGSGDPDGQS